MVEKRRIRLLWILLLIFGLLLCIQGISIVVLYEQSRSHIVEYTWKEMSDLAVLIAGDLDAEALAALKEGEEDTEEFRSMIDKLWGMQERHSAIRFVYTLKKKGDSLAFLTDSEYGRNDFEEPLIGYVYDEAPPEAFQAFEGATIKRDFYSDPWGTYMSAFAPVRDENGYPVAVVGVDFSKEFIDSRLADIVDAGFIILILSTLILLVIFVIILYLVQINRQYQREIQENECRLNEILRAVQTGVILSDATSGEIIYANPKAIEIYGSDPGSVPGMQIDSLFYRSASAKEPDDGQDYFIAADDRVIPVIRSESMTTIDQRPVRICSFMDISIQKQVEEELRKTAEELHVSMHDLALANKKLKMLTSVTRHDINNKLSVVNGSLALLEECVDSNGSSVYQLLTDAVSDISRLIGFSHIYEDMGVNSPVWQNIQKIVSAIPDSDRLIHVDIPDIEIYADPLLQKVFENLYDNSVRHGNGLTRIDVTTKVQDGELHLIWQDDGKGIPDDDKEAIFERGFGKNTGFGLFLIREILELSGATITEEGIFTEGARFVIRFPDGTYRR